MLWSSGLRDLGLLVCRLGALEFRGLESGVWNVWPRRRACPANRIPVCEILRQPR